MTRSGFTLIEVLVALALGMLVLGLAGATVVGAERFHDVLEERATAMARTTAVPQLLGGAIGRAGRGIDGCGLSLLDEGRLVRATAVEASEPMPTVVDVLAGRDGGGRHALYHRTQPYPRQPWLEEVTAFTALEARDDVGDWRPWAADGETRWSSLRLEVAWLDGDVRVYDVPLPHAPCSEAGP